MAVALWPLAAAPHADKAERVLASNPDYDLWQESFSPNGRWVVFEAVNQRQPDATSTLYVIPGAGGKDAHWTPLTDPHAWADKPRWSPDGKLLYFWLRQGSLYNVWALRFDDAHGTAVARRSRSRTSTVAARHIDTRHRSAATRRCPRTSLLLPMTDTTGSIWMLDNVDR